jgi:hypothetical protein
MAPGTQRSPIRAYQWLFRGNKGWTQADAHRLADAAWDYIGFD